MSASERVTDNTVFSCVGTDMCVTALARRAEILLMRPHLLQASCGSRARAQERASQVDREHLLPQFVTGPAKRRTRRTRPALFRMRGAARDLSERHV